MCTGCRQRRKKEEMVRLIQMSEGGMVLDGKKILPGRGIYLCPDPICFGMARKKGRVERVVGMDGTWGSLDRRVFPSREE
jgi:predicted RNA-binding protein YlxR (DUF448 family)